MIPQSQVPGVTYNKARDRWIAGTRRHGYYGSYVDQGDAERAMKKGKRTKEAVLPSIVTRKAYVDENFSPAQQTWLQRRW